MKKLIFLMFMIIVMTSNVFAEDVSLDVNPQEPIVNENFYVTFKIKSTGNVDPYISFNPSGASVLGKTEQGVSISTIVVNGKFTTTREQNYVYELVAERAGQVNLRNIKVEINGKTTALKDLNINVLSTPRKIPDAFMEAQASKTRVYLGEGIDVNYYLYFKTSISANDVKEFPKLNKFIKRFHHINSPVETVRYKGEVLKRILAYSARVYPEKIGLASLDPMTISVQIIETDYNNPFGGFGMGAQRYKNKDLSSPRIEIEVLPLPTENVPTGFTGLIGEHEFVLTPGKSKYLVNEPIELKLEVKGKGALENFDAPVIYSDPNLEQFDTKSEVTETGNQSAKKVFEYTYLARSALTIKNRTLVLAYFEPTLGKYVEKKVEIPLIEVSGIAASSANSNTNSKEVAPSDVLGSKEIKLPGMGFLERLFTSKNVESKSELGLIGPQFKETGELTKNLFILINIVLFLVVLVLSFYMFREFKNSDSELKGISKELKNEIKKMKKGGLEYSGLYKVLQGLDKKNLMAQGGVSINKVIEDSELGNEAKKYFLNSLLTCEEINFGIKKAHTKIQFEQKYFNELVKHL